MEKKPNMNLNKIPELFLVRPPLCTPLFITRHSEYWATALLMTKGGRVDLCADTGECVDICDTLSQQTYVISFRRKRERRSERKEKKKRE